VLRKHESLIKYPDFSGEEVEINTAEHLVHSSESRILNVSFK
jgi:hypothetical protein